MISAIMPSFRGVLPEQSEIGRELGAVIEGENGKWEGWGRSSEPRMNTDRCGNAAKGTKITK